MGDTQETSTDKYNPQIIEARWQKRWAETAIYRTPIHPHPHTFYCLDFFPYPSGDGLSVGHGRNYVPTDVISRYRRMKGDAVLHPMGWDAFGLPAENEAIKKGIHPRETTTRYAANYRRQMTLLGCSYDWEREINSSTPGFYRWTQWFFLLLYRRGLAYRAQGRLWWCPSCKTVLADEQVESGGVCWRCHGPVHKRDLEQWYFRITAYADELLADLETLDWPEHIRAMQRNWIGRSEGVEFTLPIAGSPSPISRERGTGGEGFTVYTTRPDTIYGMTFAVLAPEHPLVSGSGQSAGITTPERRADVTAYCETAARRSELDRLQAGRDGIFTGAYAVNPVNGARVPVYVADYVLMGYGGGAIMGVPAHDERDFYFARRQGLPAPVVIAPPGWDGEPLAAAYTGPGRMVNSGPWDGLPSGEAKERIVRWMEEQGIGRHTVQYRMRDWLISRQRYWGPPIPIVHCGRCGTVAVLEADLPVLLPRTEKFRPLGTGQSPLAALPEFVETRCPSCGDSAQRETDVSDNFLDSAWYYLRYTSTEYHDRPWSEERLRRWLPVSQYTGGVEHSTLHHLYARFLWKALQDLGHIPVDLGPEPFARLRLHGVILKDGQRMSKSRGTVVNPDEYVARYGADVLRVYLLFMGPFERGGDFRGDGIHGMQRWFRQLWRLTAPRTARPGGRWRRGSACRPPAARRGCWGRSPVARRRRRPRRAWSRRCRSGR